MGDHPDVAILSFKYSAAIEALLPQNKDKATNLDQQQQQQQEQQQRRRRWCRRRW